MSNRVPIWRELFKASLDLRAALRTIPQSICEDMVARAATGGQVAVRGVGMGDFVPEIITHLARRDMPVHLLLGRIGAWGSALAWERVEIDVGALVPYARANLIPPGMTVPTEIEPLPTDQPSDNASVSSGAPVRERRKPGPKPGAVARYAVSDRALFRRIEVGLAAGQSLTAVTQGLVREGVVEGAGTPDSRARRLARSYASEQASSSNSLPLAPTDSVANGNRAHTLPDGPKQEPSRCPSKTLPSRRSAKRTTPP